jgi:acetyltransferase-like isoleucine patch superfamily enzyme
LKLIAFLYKSILYFRGFDIHFSTKVNLNTSFSKGFNNGIKGKLAIDKKCQLSKGVIINCYGGSIIINHNTFLGEYVVIYGHGGVTIGENTLIAMHACIVSSNHTIPGVDEFIRSKPDILLPVNIGADVWIGAGCKILGGVTIGEGCVVGAGSVVTKSLPPYSICMGNPAKVMRYREKTDTIKPG